MTRSSRVRIARVLALGGARLLALVRPRLFALVASVVATAIVAGSLLYFRVVDAEHDGAKAGTTHRDGAAVPAQVAAAVRKSVAEKQPATVAPLTGGTHVGESLPNGKFRFRSTQLPGRTSTNSGAWKDVDLELVRRGATVQPRHAVVPTRFSGGGDAVRVIARTRGAVGGHEAALRWGEALSRPSLRESKATYANIRPGIDLVLEATRQGFEQYLVVRSRSAASSLDSLPLEISVDGAAIQRGTRGTFDVVDKSGAPIGFIGAVRVWDASGRGHSAAGAHMARFTQTLKRGHLRLKPDLAFLKRATTVYPVTVDPTVAMSGSGTEDSSVSSATPTTNTAGDTVLRVGSVAGSAQDAWRAYLSFDGGVPLPAGSTIASAELQLWQSSSSSCTASTFSVYGVDGSSQPAASGVTWQSQPTAGAVTAASAAHGYSADCPVGPVSVDVTDQMRAGADVGSAITAFSIRTDETNADNYTEFASATSSHPPTLVVTYNSAPLAVQDLRVVSADIVDGRVQASTLPRFEATGADWDGDDYTLEVEVHNLEDDDSESLIDSCTSSAAPSGQLTGCDLSTSLAVGLIYYARARATDSSGLAAASWSDWLEFDVIAPGVTDEPAFSLWEDEYTQDADGFAIHTTQPVVHLAAIDREGLSSLPTYEFDLEMIDEETDVAAVSEHLEPTRSGLTSQADLTVGSSQLEISHTYRFRYRITTPYDGQWYAGVSVRVAPAFAAPTLASPSADSDLDDPTPALTAQVPADADAQADDGAMMFYIEAIGSNGAASQTWTLPAAIDGGLSATLTAPNLLSGGGADGRFRWKAKWVAGGRQSIWSVPRTFRIVAKPDSPVLTRVTQNQNSLSVTWRDPRPWALLPVDHYVVSLSPGGVERNVDSGSTPTASATFNNLSVGDYTIAIRAVNAVGDSPELTSTVTVSAEGPSSPTALSSVATGRGIHVTWNAPQWDGGSTINRYVVQLLGSDPQSVEVAADADLEATFNDLPVDGYSVRVIAVNELGSGAPAYGYAQTYDRASEPETVTARPGSKSVLLSWADPEDVNGSEVSSYHVTSSPAGVDLDVPVRSAGPVVVLVDELTNDTEYMFTVTAINAAGPGPGATATATPESDVLDTDGDDLPDLLEKRLGTDTLLPDTDADGLTDGQEALHLAGLLSPTNADTDANGTEDADDDADGDHLSNLGELTDGSDPGAVDTDHDGLNDDDELSDGSNPSQGDSDGDHVGDATEVRAGLDPTTADSDGDGTPDGEALTTIFLTAPTPPDETQSGWNDIPRAYASVKVEGTDIASVNVVETDSTSMPGALTRTVRVSAGKSSTATVDSVRLGYSALVASTRVSQPTVVRWDEDTRQWIVASNSTTVNTASNTITIHSPTLGALYTVVDLGQWTAQVQRCSAAAEGSAALDAHIVIDATTSVASADPTNERFNALRSVVRSLPAGSRVSIRVSGLWTLLFGYGELLQTKTDTHQDTDRDGWAFGATSQERALDLIDWLESSPPGSGDEGSVPLWNRALPGLAEEAFGGFPTISHSGSTDDCLIPTTVLVTDGKWIPPLHASDPHRADPNYVGLRDQAVPVHVLDVGDGSAASSGWLQQLAIHSGGTYSYVPTATDVAAWTSVPTGSLPETGDFTTDTDDDGLSDWIETHGVTSALVNGGFSGSPKYTSDPAKVDTDGDGLSDAEELGNAVTTFHSVSWSAGRPVTAYTVRSDPRLTDSDTDGLSDAAEVEANGLPLDPDSDRDGLDDGAEEETGTFWFLDDTDGDGFSDLYEDRNFDGGFDPIVFTEKQSKLEWINDLALGALCGDVDLCQRDSVPWLIGNTLSSLLVYGDVRDAVWNATDGNVAGAALHAVGLLPVVGVVGKIASKIWSFIERTDGVVSRLAVRFLRGTSDDDVLLAKFGAAHAATIQKLLNIGVSNATVARLVADNGVDRIVRLAAHAKVSYSGHAPPGYFSNWKDAEHYLQDLMDVPGYRQTAERVTFANGNEATRFFDAQATIGRQVVSAESKMGFASGAVTRGQVAKDVQIANATGRKIEWHFFASNRTGRLGAQEWLLNNLNAAGIDIVVHFPR